MSKLQKTIRANGSIVFSINIPLEIIEQLGWVKGERLEIVKNFDSLVIMRGGEETNVSKIRDIPGSEQELEVLPEDSTGADSFDKRSTEDKTADSEINKGREGNGEVHNDDEGSNGGAE